MILGIETSCDDTSIALLAPETKEVSAHLSYSQDAELKAFGGVVPELAARNHSEKLPILLKTALAKSQLEMKDIDHIAVTTHPGLLGPLLTGINLAKSLALMFELPITPVNHLFAHLEAIHHTEDIPYPYLGLLVSGGHSAYFLVKAPQDFTLLGTTIDDAAGEAFDKGGKLMGLGYPAGKIIDDLAKQGDSTRFDFPIGLKQEKNCHMSFSGVKTSLRHFLEKNPEVLKNDLPSLCASYQKAIVDALVLKTKRAIELCPIKNIPIVVGGGVACNSSLRERMVQRFEHCHFVKPYLCTDNALMVANYAARIPELSLPFPQCLELDGKSKFLDKKNKTFETL